jgi:hypothetical protein
MEYRLPSDASDLSMRNIKSYCSSGYDSSAQRERSVMQLRHIKPFFHNDAASAQIKPPPGQECGNPSNCYGAPHDAVVSAAAGGSALTTMGSYELIIIRHRVDQLREFPHLGTDHADGPLGSSNRHGFPWDSLESPYGVRRGGGDRLSG